MRAWIVIAALLGIIAVDSAQAQSRRCRYDDTGTICVCRSSGTWRISPPAACRRRTPEPQPGDERTGVSPEEYLTRSENVQIQRVLNAIGCDAGEPDGLIGPATRAAIRCFQGSVGRQATGVLKPDEREALIAAEAELPSYPDKVIQGLKYALGDETAPEETQLASDESAVEDVLASMRGGRELTPPEQDTEAPEDIVKESTPPPAIADVDGGSSSQSEAPAPDPKPEPGVAAAPPPARCVDGFSDGVWAFKEVDGRGRAVAIARTAGGEDVNFILEKGTISWRFQVVFANAETVKTLIDTAQYIFVQTDKPSAIGFEDVSEFYGLRLIIPVGSANTVSMLGSRTLTLSAAGRESGPKGELTLFDIASIETDGLGRVASCF